MFITVSKGGIAGIEWSSVLSSFSSFLSSSTLWLVVVLHDMPTFLPAPSPLAMWARRQAHETAIHRYDAQHATGTSAGFDPAFASDGIDELVSGFAPRADQFPTKSSRTMVVHAEDTDDVVRRPVTASTLQFPVTPRVTLSIFILRRRCVWGGV